MKDTRSNPSNPSNSGSNPNGDGPTSGPLTRERRTDQRDTSPPPKPGSMIVKIRDNAGHIVAVDYNRFNERWYDAATRLYNTCVAPGLNHPKVRRRIGMTVARDMGFGMHVLSFRYDTASNVTETDPPVTVFVDRRIRRDEDHTRTLYPRPTRPPFNPSGA